METGEMMMATRDSGYTLIEVLVALMLLAFGLLGAVPMFVHSMRGNAAGGALGNVAAAAEQRLELLREQEYVLLAPGGNILVPVPGYSDTPQPDVLVTWRIADNASPSGTKTIMVRARERVGGMGPARRIDLIAVRGR
jgi:prepilin-type N-terminal cleavage/methylation domain-containing protein